MPATLDTPPKGNIPGCTAGLIHRGVNMHRLASRQARADNLREATFARAWERENAKTGEPRVTGTTDGHSLLAALLKPNTLDGEPCDQHAAHVAATVAQWLGTNVGFNWLEQTLHEAGYRLSRRDDQAGGER